MNWLGAFAIVGATLLMEAATPTSSAAASSLTILKPVDQAARDPGFFAFRARLQAAVARHDAAAVLAAVHPRIKNSFGGDDGRDAFRRKWTLGASASRLWAELGMVLALGGSFDRSGRFVAPYVYGRWPERIDAFEHVAIVGDRVNVRSAPRADAPRLGMLSFAIVPLARGKALASRGRWTAITMVDGRMGYVASEFVRSPVDYRAIMAREGDEWRIEAFVAGD